jgi:hypothetical protein
LIVKIIFQSANTVKICDPNGRSLIEVKLTEKEIAMKPCILMSITKLQSSMEISPPEGDLRGTAEVSYSM